MYIVGLLQRLSVIAVNHFNRPYRLNDGVWLLNGSKAPRHC